jgi:hypothetical protein
VIAALYVETNGVYYGLPDVDPWDEARDARQYAGPWPVVAHPPCARWSRLAGFTEARFGYKRGDDGGCFEAALNAVRTYGGVLEHPAHSAAWAHYGLAKPGYHGWTSSLLDDGWAAYVEQGRYGLPVKKATWLYAVGVELAPLRWGWTLDSEGTNPRDVNDKGIRGGLHAWRDSFGGRREQWTNSTHRGGHHGLTSTTPPEFRDVLLAMARSASPAALTPTPESV